MVTITSTDIESIIKELKFTTARSGGPGGQGVNKVNTKVVLHWDYLSSLYLKQEQKEIIGIKLATKINNLNEVVLASQESRSQLENKEGVINKLKQLLINAFTISKPRRPTKPTKSSVRKRLDNKKKHSYKKNLRRGLDDE